MALTSEGLEIRRYEDVLQDLITSLQTNVNPLINAEDDQVLGQIIQEFSLALANVEALVEVVNDNFNIYKAEGVYLDSLAVFRNLTRIQAAYSSTSDQLFTGTDGTIIPLGALMESITTGKRFSTLEDVTLSTTSCRDATYTVGSLLNSTSYTLTVNTTTYDYTSDASATELEILDGLKALIDADTTKTWTATVDSVNLRLKIESSDLNNLTITSTTYLSVYSVSVKGAIAATEVGAFVVPANTVTKIVSSIGGWQTTTNQSSLVVGRLQETDDEFRDRIVSTEQLSNVGTVVAITNRVRNITGVAHAVVEENATGVVDGSGRPPHAIEVIVQGGTDEDIAEEILATKAAGIPLFGNTTVLADDAIGIERTVKFTRPVIQNMAIQVTYSQYAEETLPADAESVIKDVTREYINELGLGVDVIPTRLFGPIYSAIDGIDSLTVEVQELTTSGDTPVPGNWQTSRYSIDTTEYANTELVDIYVVAT